MPYLKALTVLLYLTGCASVKPSAEDCASFRNGKYIYSIYNPTGIGHWRKANFHIELSDSIETQTLHSPMKDSNVYRLTWTGPCQYNAVLVNPNSDLDSFFLKLNPKGQTYYINKVTPDYVLIKHKRTIDTLWKVN